MLCTRKHYFNLIQMTSQQEVLPSNPIPNEYIKKQVNELLQELPPILYLDIARVIYDYWNDPLIIYSLNKNNLMESTLITNQKWLIKPITKNIIKQFEYESDREICRHGDYLIICVGGNIIYKYHIPTRNLTRYLFRYGLCDIVVDETSDNNDNNNGLVILNGRNIYSLDSNGQPPYRGWFSYSGPFVVMPDGIYNAYTPSLTWFDVNEPMRMSFFDFKTNQSNIPIDVKLSPKVYKLIRMDDTRFLIHDDRGLSIYNVKTQQYLGPKRLPSLANKKNSTFVYHSDKIYLFIETISIAYTLNLPFEEDSQWIGPIDCVLNV